MSAKHSETTERTEFDTNEDDGLRSQASRAISAARSRTHKGTLAIVAGGILLARAIRSKGRVRTAVQGLAGLALVGAGIRRRLSPGGSFETEQGAAGGPGGVGVEPNLGTPTRTDHARQSDTNPRDVDQEPDVETRTESDEGSVQFTDEGDDEPRSKPHLEGEESEDPRRDVADDDVEVDISESAMADEPSEAAGPDPEQAEPTQTDDTEPEASPTEDDSHVGADEPDDEADSESDDESS